MTVASPMPVEAPVTSTVPVAMGRNLSASFAHVDVDDAIRTRRTHKAYGSEPVPRETLDELFDLARWAPNHNLTNPWRFRVVGPETLARLKEAAGEEAAAKLERAPTLIVASVVVSGDPVQDEEDHAAGAVAAYIVLLAAHARGLAGYWRTPEVLRTPGGCSAAGVPDGERVIGLLHLGPPRQEKEPPERLPPGDFVTYLP
jgi:nitroreductase